MSSKLFSATRQASALRVSFEYSPVIARKIGSPRADRQWETVRLM